MMPTETLTKEETLKRARGPGRAAVGAEVENLLGTDDLRILQENVNEGIGASTVRRFGRRWQVNFQIHF